MKKIVSVLLVTLMVFSMIPMSVLAAGVDISVLHGENYTIISDDKSTLAPGVTMNEVVMYDKNGDRVEMYVTTSDPSVDTVEFYANYKNNQCAEWGLQTLSEQVAAIEANYEEPFKVVAGLNASYYNTATGAPTGAFVMEGVDASASGDNYAFFAVLKDGTVMIGDKGEYSSYKGKIKEAIGGYVHIVKDGAIVSGLDKVTKYPRQTIGITADGKVITMTADGSQAPKTIGLTYYEQAQVMLELGCVDALHLDGGNSATFGAVREGTDDFVLVNSPSGSVERAVSNTLMIVSTAIPDGTFDRAVISGEYEHFAPYSSYTFSAKGVDASGGPAKEIPSTVTWALSDNSFGTVSNGTFVSNGKLGDVDVQMIYNGNVVGSKSISVVNPTSISFGADEKTVPYGKSASLAVTAMYDLNEMYASAEAYTFAVANSKAGAMDGFDFAATADETITSTTVTATYNHSDKLNPISVTVKFGKGSEVIYDFEGDNVDDWLGADKISDWVVEKNKEILEKYPDAKYTILDTPTSGNGCGTKSSSTFLATEENGGKVKNGNSSLGLTFKRLYDEDTGEWSYNYMFYTGDTQVWRDVANGKNATKIGMWIYLPKEAAGIYARICRTFTKDSSGKLYTNYDYLSVNGKKVSQFTDIPESGWVYAEFDLTAYDYQSSLQFNPYEDYAMNNGKGSNSNYYPGFLQFFVNTYDMEAEEYSIYIDDITLDYSDVTEDRDTPVISNATVAVDALDYVALDGQTVKSNVVSFAANITEQTTKSNFTGLDYSTAQIYIDGAKNSAKSNFVASGNTLALSDMYLCDGMHEIVFEIADKQGNYTKLTKTIVVDGSADNAQVSITGHNNGNHSPKAGSLYYIDVVASDPAQIKSISTKLKMQTANAFELDHIIAADGVNFTYEFDKLNNTLTLDITNDGTATDKILLSVPVRVWSWSEEATGITAAAQWATTNSPIVKIQCATTLGEVTFADGVLGNQYTTSFYSAIDVATEVDDKTKWHSHTATAMEDVAAKCTESGYEGRTYCEGCASVVDWGTTIDALGHDYSVVDAKLTCVLCGDSTALNGIAQVGKDYFYFVNGIATSGWQMIDGSWHYFDETTLAAVSGKLKFGTITYEFEENGKLASGVWAPTLFGYKYYYGPDHYRNGWYNIDGKDYFFEDDIRLDDGWQQILEGKNYGNWYFFNEDGSCDKTVRPQDGFYTDRNGLGYAKDGIGLSGLHEIDGKYYYFNFKGYAQKNNTYAGRLFKDDYAAYTGLLEKDGVKYYYIDGLTATNGVYNIDGEYYYVYWGGVVKTDGQYYISNTFCDLPAGEYTVDAEGKLLNDIIEADGKLYLYINGTTATKGLHKVGNAYYYSIWGGELKTDDRYYVSTSYCDLPAGNYSFGADGKMLDGIVEKDGKLYLYINGTTVTKGLYKIGDAYYYSYWGGELKTDDTYYVSETFCDLPVGNYTFGADGKMLNGVVEVNDKLYLHINGTTATKGLYKIGDAYYYSYWGGELKTDDTYYVSETFCDLPVGNYTFGADGKMLDGVVEVNDKLYLYINGTTATKGLYKIGDAYYYSYWGGELKTDDRYYVSETFCDLPVGNYTFGADGKMLDGVVEVNDKLYLYINGTTATKGLHKIGDTYYYSYWGGELMIDDTYYVSETFCDLPVGNYTFGADGKMLDGFVTVDGTIYYYKNGSCPAPGIIEVEGDYYFVTWNGKVITNQKFHVFEGNGYTIEMTYKFDETGKIIGR